MSRCLPVGALLLVLLSVAVAPQARGAPGAPPLVPRLVGCGGERILHPSETVALRLEVTNRSGTPRPVTVRWTLDAASGRDIRGAAAVRLGPAQCRRIALTNVPLACGFYAVRVSVEEGQAPARSLQTVLAVVHEPTAASRRRFGLGHLDPYWGERLQGAEIRAYLGAVKRLGAGWVRLGGSTAGPGAGAAGDVTAWRGTMAELRRQGLQCNVFGLKDHNNATPAEYAERLVAFTRAYRPLICGWDWQSALPPDDLSGERLAAQMRQVCGRPIMLSPYVRCTMQSATMQGSARYVMSAATAGGFLIKAPGGMGLRQGPAPAEVIRARSAMAAQHLAAPVWAVDMCLMTNPNRRVGRLDPVRAAGRQANDVAVLMLEWASVLGPRDRWHYQRVAAETGARARVGLLEPDLRTPRPAAAAYATAAHWLAEARPLTRDALANGVIVQHFSTPRGPLTACWLGDDARAGRPAYRPIIVRTSGPITRIGVLGDETDLSRSGTLHLRLGAVPCYFLGRVRVEAPKAADTAGDDR